MAIIYARNRSKYDEARILHDSQKTFEKNVVGLLKQIEAVLKR